MSNRFFLEQIFAPNETVTLEGEEFHHLAHVMRKKEGEEMELVNGKNQLASARLTKVTKKSATFQILALEEGPKKPNIVLAQALFRLARLEWLIEKAVELDVTEIALFPAARSEKKALSNEQLRRLQQIAVSALKQCHRLDLPEIRFYQSLAEVPAKGSLFFGDLRPSGQRTLHAPCTIFIGPEGGFTDEEIALLEQKGAKGTSLHPNVLRAETAAIAALVSIK